MNIVVASLEFKSSFGLSFFKQDSLSIDIPFSLRPAACPNRPGRASAVTAVTATATIQLSLCWSA